LPRVELTSLDGGTTPPDETGTHEQHVELASEAVVEDRVEERGDERHASKDHERVGHGCEVQHDAEHGDDEADALRERGRAWVFEVTRCAQARANGGLEEETIRVTPDAGEGAPREECRDHGKENERRLAGALGERCRERCRGIQSETDHSEQQHGSDAGTESGAARVDSGLAGLRSESCFGTGGLRRSRWAGVIRSHGVRYLWCAGPRCLGGGGIRWLLVRPARG